MHTFIETQMATREARVCGALRMLLFSDRLTDIYASIGKVVSHHPSTAASTFIIAAEAMPHPLIIIRSQYTHARNCSARNAYRCRPPAFKLKKWGDLPGLIHGDSNYQFSAVIGRANPALSLHHATGWLT